MKNIIYPIENEHIAIVVKSTGAELCSIQKNGKEYLWLGDENFWSGQSPVLFPIVGGLKKGGYFYRGNFFKMPKHGFLRTTQAKKVIKREDSLTFVFENTAETFDMYPFEFCFSLVFELIENTLKITHYIENKGNETMYFSTGGHPAFFCNTAEKTRSYTENYLRFDKKEHLETQLVDMTSGLIKNKYATVLENSDTIYLQKNSFKNDALIFSNLQSTSVVFGNKTDGDLVKVHFENMPYIAFWAKENAPFVCIEPWAGIGDLTDTKRDISKKIGIIPLCAGEKTSRYYTLEIC